MATWIKVKVKTEQIVGGKTKKVTEPYLVDAYTLTEAEARINEKLKTIYTDGDFSIKGAEETKISEIFGLDVDEGTNDKWYLAKISFITIDEKTGKDKKTVSQMLVRSGSFEGALEGVNAGMKGTLADWDIVSIAETNIVDVFRWETK